MSVAVKKVMDIMDIDMLVVSVVVFIVDDDIEDMSIDAVLYDETCSDDVVPIRRLLRDWYLRCGSVEYGDVSGLAEGKCSGMKQP